MKIIAIIQARMGSTRLPGKMMMDLVGKPVIEYVFDRVSFSSLISEIWLATTVDKKDDILVKWAQDNHIKYYRGDENDVLNRYYQTVTQAKADVIVRVTGDCPLADSDVIDKVIGEYLKGKYDYVSNIHPPTYPDGLDVEVFSFKALKKAWQEAKLGSEREHVTPYIWKNPKLFKIKNVVLEQDYSNYRWTLDTQEDFDFIEKIIVECKNRNSECRMAGIIEIIKLHSEWLKINKKYTRNEGYDKSLKGDK